MILLEIVHLTHNFRLNAAVVTHEMNSQFQIHCCLVSLRSGFELVIADIGSVSLTLIFKSVTILDKLQKHHIFNIFSLFCLKKKYKFQPNHSSLSPCYTIFLQLPCYRGRWGNLICIRNRGIHVSLSCGSLHSEFHHRLLLKIA